MPFYNFFYNYTILQNRTVCMKTVTVKYYVHEL